ncbi:hypothetical protein OEZ85_013217 [Tetradesmus obliquus]|uniref:Survival of motor neuron-related-splicing factor 30 n=1 Tax=Tetradesmus obliquus TaxID=3088 RepID=A0ABY8U505_TETOB|nr:hypothetical protein OEZ85_013217 [Tetradesmus obliquus]
MAEETHSVEELQQNLHDYREQQQQVETLLLSDPGNEELREMYDSLSEVIQLTVDLLKDAGASEAAAAAAAAVPAAAGLAAAAAAGAAAPALAAAAAAGPSSLEQQQQIVTPAELNIAAMLPASVADQIRRAQVKQALLGQGNAAWAVGAACLALYSGDGQYYPATVKAVTDAGNFVVLFEGYGNEEELPAASVRPPLEDSSGYTGVAAPKRKRVEEEPTVDQAPPKWLEIKPTDDEKTVARKKKLLKSFKSKRRFQEMDIKQKEHQSNWQSFLKGKGGKPKTGYFTGRKKESMFKVPDNGKVGVIGSGKGVTEYKKAARHEFQVE